MKKTKYHNIVSKKFAKAATAVAIALATGFTFTACNTPAEKNSALRIAYLPITHSLPLFALNELPTELRQSKQVELVKFGSWNELSDALNTGHVDGAVLLTEIAVKAKENGVPLKAVALGHHDGNVVIVDPDIEDASQLRGKTIAIPHRLSSHNIILNIVLERHGLKPTDIQVTELPPPEMPAALAEKRIAAYIVAEPFGAKAVVQGVGRVLYSSPEVWPHSVCCTLVLREETTKENRQAAANLIHDYQVAADSLSHSKEWQLEVAGKYLTAPKDVLSKSLEWIDFADLRVRQSEYDTLSNWMSRLGLSEHAPSFEAFADTVIWYGAE